MLTSSGLRHFARIHLAMPASEALKRAELADPRFVQRVPEWASRLGPPLATTLIPFLLIVYVALKGGGYDAIIRGEVGVAVWWIVLIGSIVGILPLAKITRAGWIGIASLTALAIWTAAGISWSESSERSVAELARVATYLGILVLALAVQGRDGLRRTVIAVGAAISLIAVLALLSRLHPAWFPENETGIVLDYAQARLNYPVDYWNGLAALMAMGLPLMLAIAIESRHLAAQALATAVIPVFALVGFYTLSRGGALEGAVALVAFFVLYPRRLAALPTALLAGCGSILLILAATQRAALENGLVTPEALAQGDEMLAITCVVCVGVGLLRAALGLAARHGLGPRLNPSRGASIAGVVAVLAVVAVGALAAGAPSEISNRWEEFKAPVGPEAGNTAGRFESASGNGRYQYWRAAVDANATDPLLGIGPGTFEFYWAREGDYPGFIRDAHSLYFEALAGLGIVGLILVVAPLVALLWLGGSLSLRASTSGRPWVAAATAACAAFAAAAAVDWVWELAVLPIVLICIGAAILGHRRGQSRAKRADWRPRLGLALLAVAAAAAVGVPLVGAKLVQASQDDADVQQYAPALNSADKADELQPWAATPPLQQALVLELQGDLDAAAAAAREATAEEPTNWRTWLVLSRIEASRGDDEASAAAYESARALNPRSPLFAR